jgi:hypothetical protein
MYERSHSFRMVPYHGRVLRLYAEGVEHYNLLQVRRSYRWVFCQANQFEQAVGECALHPEACDPGRQRMEVVVDGDLVRFLTKG